MGDVQDEVASLPLVVELAESNVLGNKAIAASDPSLGRLVGVDCDG